MKAGGGQTQRWAEFTGISLNFILNLRNEALVSLGAEQPGRLHAKDHRGITEAISSLDRVVFQRSQIRRTPQPTNTTLALIHI